ncbi:MAG: protein-L-isoaspartate(D-aspartate) O-methyltransferase [Spirochaetaceae bacterium]|nr:MAG: protein-L-isoaspartate(D-aspartate) O-methyltransferase [Spirochaetaceae bacterium]
MVRTQIAERDVGSPAVLKAMRQVPRHRFLPNDSLENAYGDHARPIGNGQTCSQPYIVAHMSDWADIGANDRVLEIGTGSGYQAAIAAEIAREVYTIELNEDLARSAQTRLKELGYSNIRFFTGDGYQGIARFAPYDIVLITAGAPELPEPLLEQLADNGRLVGPIGHDAQQLVRVQRKGGRFETEHGIYVRFVPFVSNGFESE